MGSSTAINESPKQELWLLLPCAAPKTGTREGGRQGNSHDSDDVTGRGSYLDYPHFADEPTEAGGGEPTKR